MRKIFCDTCSKEIKVGEYRISFDRERVTSSRQEKNEFDYCSPACLARGENLLPELERGSR